MLIQLLGLVGTILVIGISGWNLYLSHYKEGRSEVELLPHEGGTGGNSFAGGSNAEDSSARWTGNAFLKITNTGEAGAYISSVDHELIGLRDGDDVVEPTNVSLNESRASRQPTLEEIEPGRTTRYKPYFGISPEHDVSVLLEHDAGIIRHTIGVEDNKGSYTVSYDTEMSLTGPKFFREDENE